MKQQMEDFLKVKGSDPREFKEYLDSRKVAEKLAEEA